jgi:predicted MFS family arabinose efflux permease
MNLKISSLKKAYVGISPQIWVLAVSMFINRIGSMVLLFMSVYLTKEKQFSIPDAGIIMSMFGFGSLFGAFIGGKLVDKIGFYPILIWSLLLSGIMLLVLGQMQSFALISLFTFLVSATGDAFRPANTSSISTYATAETYTQSIALNRLAMNLGFMLGPLAGGILASINYHFLFWADGLTCIFSALFIFIILPKPPRKVVVEKNVEATLNKKQSSPYHDKMYLYFLFFTCLYAICFFQLITILPLYFEKIYHMKERNIGILMGLNGLGVAVIEMFLIYYIKNRWSQFKFIALGVFLLVISFLILIPFHSVFILVISIIVITFSEMFAMPFMSTYAINKAPKVSMGQYMGLYSISWSVALIVSPLLSTNVIHWKGFNALWLILAGLCFISFLGFRWMENKLNTGNIN